MKKIIFLSLSLIGFYSFSQELSCKDFKEGTFFSKMTDPVNVEYKIVRLANTQTEFPGELPDELKGTDFSMAPQYAIIEWVDDCTYILKYDESKTELTEIQKMVNKLGGFINEMVKIEDGCFYYKSTLKFEEGEKSLEGKFCKE